MFQDKTLYIKHYFEDIQCFDAEYYLAGKYYYRIFFRILARLPFKSVNYVAPCCVVSKLMINRKNETEKIGFRLGLSIGHHISIINILHDIKT